MIKSFIITSIIAMAVVYVIICLESYIASAFLLKTTPNNRLKHILLKPFADVIKIFIKKDCTAPIKRKFLFFTAPIIVFCPVITAFCLVPFNSSFVEVNFDTNLLLFLALVLIPVIGRFLAGFSSNNNLSLIGGTEQILKLTTASIPIILSVLAVSYMAESLNINKIIEAQSSTHGLFGWFFLPLFIGAAIFFISAFILFLSGNFRNLTSKSTAAADYTAEYSGIKLALLEISDYMLLFLFSALFVSLFFGGYLNPFGAYILPENLRLFEQSFWFLAKIFIVIFFVFFVQIKLPKAKNDGLLGFSYKVLLPLSLINLNIAILILYFSGN